MQHVQARDRRDLWEKFWYDKEGNIIIFQTPNIWLIAWVVLAIVSLVVPRGNASNIFWWLSTASLTIWSLLEIFKGANYFRRALGVVVLLLIIASAFNLGR